MTAGFRCAPLTPPATYTAKATAKPQPQEISSQSPVDAETPLPRPDWFSAATVMATTPQPKAMITNVPKNSATSSPTGVRCQRKRPWRCAPDMPTPPS